MAFSRFTRLTIDANRGGPRPVSIHGFFGSVSFGGSVHNRRRRGGFGVDPGAIGVTGLCQGVALMDPRFGGACEPSTGEPPPAAGQLHF
jgi:hypothetical protein